MTDIKKVPLGVSCPKCGKVMVLEMSVADDAVKSLQQYATEYTTSCIGVSAFNGYRVCPNCSSTIVGTFTLTAHERKTSAE